MRYYHPTRRDFLRILSSSLGCVLLGSGCGSDLGGSDGGGGSLLDIGRPSGYVFYPLFKVGQRYPDIVALTTEVLMDESGHVVFFAEHSDGRLGLYYLTFEMDARQGVIVQDIRRLLKVGDQLAGREVAQIASLDINEQGHVAIVVCFDVNPDVEPAGPMAVVMDRGRGLEVVLDYGDPLPGNVGRFGGDIGDLKFEGDDLLLVARYDRDGSCGQGVHFLPGAQVSQSKVVLSTFDAVPEADGVIDCIGLVDLDNHGHFVAQGFADDPLAVPGAQPKGAGRLGSFLMKGNVHQGTDSQCLLSACPSLVLARSVQGRFDSADNPYGARVCGDRDETCHLSLTAQGLTLFRNQTVIAQPGMNSPGGSIIRSLLPGVFNDYGVLYYQLITSTGLELCAHYGRSSALLLSRGQRLGDRRVDTMALGFHTSQADNRGRVVLYAQLDDQTETILLGVPV